MFGKKKKTSQEVKWIVTFADLITLLFCFFVYLSLFNKRRLTLKQVSLSMKKQQNL
jgi:flagellar motor protein MotB